MLVSMLPGWSNKTNPYNSLLCDALVAAGATVREYSLADVIKGSTPDIVHVHWPEYALTFESLKEARLRVLKLRLGIFLAKARGARVFWTAHNLRPHERHHEHLEAAFYRYWLKAVDGLICLSESSWRAAAEMYPALNGKPHFVIRHGDYRPRLSGKVERDAVRQSLGVAPDETLLVSLGAIREYKNVPHLIRVFREADMPQCKLLVAGRVANSALREEILHAMDTDTRVILREGFMDDETMESLTVAGDLTVLPYRDILNSGTALFSLSCNRPVLVPRVGSLPELHSDVGPEWVKMFDGELDAMQLREAASTRGSLGCLCPLEKYSWQSVAAETMHAYEVTLSGTRS